MVSISRQYSYQKFKIGREIQTIFENWYGRYLKYSTGSTLNQKQGLKIS